jgi:hypothetical protein
MPQTANPAPGAWLMSAKESVSFTLFIPICQHDGESSHLYLYYGGMESNGNCNHVAFERKHAANGDLQERLTVSTKPEEGSEPAKYVWQLDEHMADAFWVNEIMTELASTRRGELKEFLAQCLQDAMGDPAKTIPGGVLNLRQILRFLEGCCDPVRATRNSRRSVLSSFEAWSDKARADPERNPLRKAMHSLTFHGD